MSNNTTIPSPTIYKNTFANGTVFASSSSPTIQENASTLVTVFAPSPSPTIQENASTLVTLFAPSPSPTIQDNASPPVTVFNPSPPPTIQENDSTPVTVFASNNSTTPSSPSSPGTSTTAIAIATSFSVVGAVVLLVLAVLIIKYIRKKKLESTSAGVDPALPNSVASGDPKNSKDVVESTPKNSEDDEASTESFLDKIPKEKPKRFTWKDLQVFTRNKAEKLGSGGFGEVFKGEFPGGIPFAVKILNQDLGKRAEAQFKAEVSTLSRTNHVNLVGLHGYCSEAEVKAMVYEYMVNGSLDGYLYGQKDKIEWRKLYEIAVGTAKGIQYLHEECGQQIVHYDIKPANILLSKNWSPKIADFGLAEMFDRQKTLDTIKNNIMGGKGTPGFAAPEIWMPDFPVTPKCDVYSFGKVLFSMLWSTWGLKFKEQKQDLNELTFESWVRKKVDGDELGSVISNCGNEEDRENIRIMCKVALQCVKEDPGERPSMSEVVHKLNPDNKKDELTATA